MKKRDWFPTYRMKVLAAVSFVSGMLYTILIALVTLEVAA